MKLEDSTAYTAKCFRGDPASCSYACHFRMDIRSLMEKVSKGRWGPAYKVLRNAVVFPAIVSALCDQPCRKYCQRHTVLGDEAVSMRDIESACLRFTRNRKPEVYVIPPKTQRIAVVGAGPAGLSCALLLAQKRFAVTVFEKENGWGGSLRSHPLFADFEADIALQFSAVKCEFRFGSEVKSLDDINDFDAIYVATGAGGESFGLLPGWDAGLLSTSIPKVFMGGSVAGASLMQAIAHGPEASKMIEVFLQIGKAVHTYGYSDKNYCERFLQHEGAVSAPRIEPSGPGGYTEEEAKAEAARCLQCDCNKCMESCEMLKRFRKDPHKIAVEVYNDMGANPPFSVRAITREVYSCNICGYCKSICPEQVDIGGLMQFSRAARMSAGIHPAALHDFWLREMDFASSEGYFASAPQGQTQCDYAFYPGCQLGAANPEHVIRSFEFLRKDYNAGVILGCCGAPAYWAGDQARLQSNCEKLRQQWLEMGRPTLVCACATCETIISMLMPEIERISLYELLARSDAIEPDRLFTEAAVFDPCAAREDAGMQEGVRKLAGKAGIALEELREHNRCCGYGGHMRIANPSLYDEIATNRISESGKPYIVYCANCREVFASKGKNCAHILDAVFGLHPGEVPPLQQKRENSLKTKRELMKQTQGIDFIPESHPWDNIILIISDELQEKMERKLISAADVKEAIWLAEKSGESFYDESDGTRICSMVKPVITYWVQYRKTANGAYEVFSAYYHRMRISREESTR